MTACKPALTERLGLFGCSRSIGQVVVLIVASCWASGAHADDIFGTWLRGDQAARVVIAECGTSICATNVWIRNPAAQNEKVGDKLIFSIKRQGDSWSGTGRDPQRDLSFSATLRAEGAKMTTRGCMLGGLMCNTTNWTRQ